ncbi:adenylyltransferase/cytidyltransferase family protein, partial [Flavobacteriaceae bacterium]|nr:adenylyltransferase/cytidyltransferase family protein [Flavobacteriaceae bacterium]
MTIAIYTGTFDPVTLGHLDIIHRASKIFDNLIVAVALDNGKQTLFSDDERRIMIEESLISQVGENEAKKIKIVSFSGLLVNFAKKNKAQVLIR